MVRGEDVFKRVTRSDGTLVNTNSSVHIISGLLKEAVPVLHCRLREEKLSLRNQEYIPHSLHEAGWDLITD